MKKKTIKINRVNNKQIYIFKKKKKNKKKKNINILLYINMNDKFIAN